MCGIAGIFVRSDNTKINLDAILDTMLGEIAERGGDATGYLAMGEKGVLEWQRAAVDVPDFIHHRRRVPKGTRTILAHTRWATQGHAGFMENNHPIRRGPFYVIHNGHVSNDWELFKLAGRERFGQVDTEAIAAYIAHLGELEKVNLAMEEIEGAAAIAVVDERNPEKLVLARGHSSPLNVLVTEKVVIWGSTQATVKLAYKKHIGKLPRRQKIESLAEGDMLLVTPTSVERSTFAPYVWVSKYRTPLAYETPADSDGSCAIPTGHVLPSQEAHWWEDDDDWASDPTTHESWNAEDYLNGKRVTECDECGGVVPIMDIIRVPEPDGEGFEWKLCEDCAKLWDRLADEEYQRANAASLSQLDR